jgi:hypothetical protein
MVLRRFFEGNQGFWGFSWVTMDGLRREGGQANGDVDSISFGMAKV